MIAACTIVSKNYLAFARTLAHSYRRHHPDARVFVLLVDRVDGYFDPSAEPFALVEIGELPIPDLPRFCFQYSVLELNTAVKPYFLAHLMDKHGVDKLIYFDPDILVLGDMGPVERLLDRCSIVLTPHLTAPIEDAAKPTELDLRRAGAYNLGFIALARTSTTRRFLDWWQRRLYTGCLMEPDRGMHVDQGWVDLVPGLFDGVHILRDDGYNVAYWNLHSRAVTAAGDRVGVNGRPCRFFHFSGIDPEDVTGISRHQNRFHLSDIGEAGAVFQAYAAEVLANGHREVKRWPYAFGAFGSGEPISADVRRAYWAMGDAVQQFGDPFAGTGPGSFHHWLATRVQRLPLPSRLYLRLVRPRESAVVPRLRRALGRHRRLWGALKAVRNSVRWSPAADPLDWRPPPRDVSGRARDRDV